jgi:hypothetical protein
VGIFDLFGRPFYPVCVSLRDYREKSISYSASFRLMGNRAGSKSITALSFERVSELIGGAM